MNLHALGPTSTSTLGTPIGLGCERCELLDICGGTTDFDCYAGCCRKPASCTLACPSSHRFAEAVRDAAGMQMKTKYAIGQRPEELPVYIPHVQNGSSRAGRLSAHYVALTTFDVSAPDSNRVFAGPQELRDHFRLSANAKIVLISVAKDNRLEHHWRFSETRSLSQYMATLGISHITAPNFSFALNEPRPEHLVNRSRSLSEAERMAGAGLSVIPHVNAFNQKDWACWRDFLRDHPHLYMVAQEFQTGLSSGKRARWHISHLLNIQQSLGRGLQLIAVGARRHLPLLLELSGVTVVDANPFMKTHKRQRLANGKWLRHPTPDGESLDQLMEHNIRAYSKWVNARIAYLREFATIEPRYEVTSPSVDQMWFPVSDSQLSLRFPPSAVA